MVGLEKEGAPLTDLGLRPDEDIPDDKIAGPFEQLGVLRNQLAEAAKAKAAPSNFQIRPGYDELFRPDNVKEVIHDVLHDGLRGKVYSEESADVWAKSIADNLRNKVRDMGYPRYKLIVQVVLGEQQGAGIKIASRCLWDADSDNYASYVFMNETIFCMAAVYAIHQNPEC
ncbi:dynein light chain Tctex-type protein 2B isoform X2 [Anabrus simplex]|uniref:dynein light chain Tctex-type protein 2B isoform X2 n=1 Tax=Anabrus simplex TaxID=316456 RepID=UPI0034DD2E9C